MGKKKSCEKYHPLGRLGDLSVVQGKLKLEINLLYHFISFFPRQQWRADSLEEMVLAGSSLIHRVNRERQGREKLLRH